MQLRIIRTTLIAAGLAATLALAACSNDDDHAGMPMDHSAESRAGSATAPPAGNFNHADVAFAQGMIPHHQQAIDIDGQRLYLDVMIRHHQGAIHMAETEIEDGNNEDAIKLAKQIAETQQQEIETMQELLAKL